MCIEPFPDLTIETANEASEKIKIEKELATLFASVENKAYWFEDEECDFCEKIGKHNRIMERVELWFYLSDKLKKKIFDILQDEGVQIPNNGQIIVLESFMKRNGFVNEQGWWIKHEK